MAKVANYFNKKTGKKVEYVIDSLKKSLPKMEAALKGEYFRKGELREIGGLSAKMHAAFVYLTAEVAKQDDAANK